MPMLNTTNPQSSYKKTTEISSETIMSEEFETKTELLYDDKPYQKHYQGEHQGKLLSENETPANYQNQSHDLDEE